MRLTELRTLCVDAFPTSPTRLNIFTALKSLCDYLEQTVGAAELWIDGSFITEKLDPEDTDITVVIEEEVFRKLDIQTQDELAALVSGKNFDKLVHNFLEIKYPRDHPNWKIWEENAAGWSQWWSVGEKSNFVRGIPVIRLGESDVGHNLLRR